MLLNDDEQYRIHFGDCIPHLYEMPRQSVDFSVYSPPFSSVFSYTSLATDLGNSEDFRSEVPLHFSFFFRSMLRILKPGRVMMVHCQQIVRMKRSGGEGMYDFRGLLIRLAQRAGFVYDYDWIVTKNPQALKNGTGVLTPTGFVPINDLRIGDSVIGGDGMPTQVAGVWPHKQKQMYRVMFNDGSSVECDGNHLWSVNKLSMRYESGFVAMRTEEIYREAQSSAGKCRRKVPLTSVDFPTAEQPIDPYLLGVLLGDGILGSRGTVAVCTDREIVDSLSLPKKHYTRKYAGSDRGGDVATHAILCDEWHRNDVLEACREVGIAGKRAWEKHIPKQYLIADRNQRVALLQGLMDTDGTIKKNRSCFYVSVSRSLADGVQFLVESLGGMCKIYTEEAPRFKYKGEIRIGRTRFVCCIRLPKASGICPFRLKKKVDRWRPLAREIHRRIVSIEPTEISDCTCITVEARDGLFVTEHCIVTHNSQAIRTKSRSLQFAGLESDRAKSRGAMGDYLIKFYAPGENKVPVQDDDKRNPEVTRNNWIEWAEGCWPWTSIRETETLNVAEGRGEDDTKHICPLQLPVIRRLVKLYSNPGEIVFSPFAGIGSELFVSLQESRRAYGCELKPEYHAAAIRNCDRAINERVRPVQSPLFA